MTHENIIERINKNMGDDEVPINETANDYFLLFKQHVQDTQNELVGTKGTREKLNRLNLHQGFTRNKMTSFTPISP